MRHFCQLTRNCALASSKVGDPLVAIPSMGLAYTVTDQKNRGYSGGLPVLIESPTSRASYNDVG